MITGQGRENMSRVFREGIIGEAIRHMPYAIFRMSNGVPGYFLRTPKGYVFISSVSPVGVVAESVRK
jgi:hypothetical protein